jgi:hypothetical protein
MFMGPFSMETKKLHVIAVIAASAMSFLPVTGEAAGSTIRGRFSYEGFATCQQPAVRNFPIRVEGTASLSTDRRASIAMTSNTGDSSRLNATLGGKPTAAPGGSTALNVVRNHTLRA